MANTARTFVTLWTVGCVLLIGCGRESSPSDPEAAAHTKSAVGGKTKAASSPKDPAEVEAPAKRPAEPALNAKDFEAWVAKTRAESERAKTAPAEISDAVETRLQDSLAVTDRAVLDAVNAWVSFESRPATAAAGTRRFSESLRLIASLQSLLPDRDRLRAQLLMKRAGLKRNVDDVQGSVADYRAAEAILRVAAVETDRSRIESLVEIAGGLYVSGKRDEAEEWYLKLMSYPWYLVEDAAAQRFLKEKYVEAVRGLIECRRGRLDALKEVFIVPATEKELRPVLDAPRPAPQRRHGPK